MAERGPLLPHHGRLILLSALASSAALAAAQSVPLSDDPTFIRSPGRCAMRDSCGRKSAFGGEIPCPDNREASNHDRDAVYLATLAQVCGDDFPTTTCCTQGQLETLSSSLAQAEPLIASCPACRSNFRHFYCAFTCSPDQSLFLTVTSTQTLNKDGQARTAVKSVDFSVSEQFGQGFFDSCKSVKFGATNGYAMDLLGGGATDYLSFLRYMGQERALGSPFQIDFPPPSILSSTSLNSTVSPPTPFADAPLSCSSSDLSARCACPDCPSVCAALPPVLSPSERAAKRCMVGRMDCFPFALAIVYAVTLVAASTFLLAREARARWGTGGIKLDRAGGGGREASALGEEEDEVEGGAWTRLRHRLSFARWNNRSDVISALASLSGRPASPLPLEEDGAVDPLDPEAEYDDEPVQLSATAATRTGRRGLVDATSLPSELGGGDSNGGRRSNRQTASTISPHSSRSGNAHRLSLADPLVSAPLQPRTYPLNTLLSTLFYRLGLFCAHKPFLTLSLGLAVCALANLGWGRFEVERDPVRLWVPKGSETARQKENFDEAFGPFYRTEQVFLSVAPRASAGMERAQGRGWQPVDEPVLDFSTLQFLDSVESDIRTLRSPASNLSLSDVCFAPSVPSDSPTSDDYCIVQSPLGYFQSSLAGITPSNWASTLDACATSPASCLPTFGQPLNPRLVLGGLPDGAPARASEARAVVLTYVLSNSLDPALVARAEEWESALESYLSALAAPAGPAAQRGLAVSYSTGLSLEQELNAATNTDVPIVVLSYLVMFLYVAVNLGGSGSGLLRTLGRAMGLLAAGLMGAGRWIEGRLRRGGVKLGEEEGRMGPGGGRARTASLSQRLAAGSGSGLGAYFRRQVLVDSKVLLGLWGIVIVLLSVSTSVALCSAFGVKVTLIIAEVIPFLVLAIGVDNVFILSHELDQQNARAYATSRHSGAGTSLLLNEDEEDFEDDESLPSAEERVARTLGRMGPSILLSASCETVAFALGALVGMPAVRNFAIYAAGAVLVNALLQVTIFVSAMALDLRRVESNRIDCFPCIKLPSASAFDLGAAVTEGFLARFVRTVYAPNLLRKPVKYLVVALFSGLFVLSWMGARHIDLGLDQRLALPSSSYLVDYFNAVDTYLDVGPPVYFVLGQGINMTQLASVQQVCGRFSTCKEYSLANVLEAERKRPESSFLAEPPAVWTDDFVQWLNPLLEDCCRVKRRDPTQFCGPHDPPMACRPCFEDREPAWSTTLEGLPEGEEFMRYVEQWLDSPTDESCPLGGKASYSSALSLEEDYTGVGLSHFRTYHTPLKTQADFINAYAAAQRIAADLSKRTGAEVFPYSLFYVYFATYSHLWATTREVLAFALFAVFAVTSLLLGSLRTGTVVACTVLLSLVSVIGLMGAWGVSLNPLSLVNLVISVGIAVEFCSHIARAFMGASGGGLPYHHPAGERDRDERAYAALVDVGGSVISGITVTKLIGIAVLALTRSKLLEIYYFRMWLSLILSGALHGLVFLPVALSLWGGQGYALTADESDGGWIASSVQRRYERENRPFLDDDSSSVDSDDQF
ncbi:hypothetical protein JCM21900_002773 [Sporobolomyces salmonicolor]